MKALLQQVTQACIICGRPSRQVGRKRDVVKAWGRQQVRTIVMYECSDCGQWHRQPPIYEVNR